MKPIRLLYLSQQDVVQTGLDLAQAVKVVIEVLTEHGRGRFENPPKPGVHPLSDAFIHAMPGYLPRKKAIGLKWVSGFSSNAKRRLPTITGLIVLNHPRTGFPLAIMEAAYITALRTAAVSGVAARHLARPDAQVLGIVGAGVQGRYNLLTLRQVLPALRRVQVYDINAGILRDFTKTMTKHVPLEIQPAKSAEEAIRGADVVVTATGVLGKPIFFERWIRRSGVLVLPVHSKGWETSALRRADKFVVDDWQQFSSVLGQRGGYYWPLPRLHAELGQIVVGLKPGRQSPDERIVNINFGMAIHDVAMAQRAYALARRTGLGKELTLMDRLLPLM